MWNQEHFRQRITAEAWRLETESHSLKDVGEGGWWEQPPPPPKEETQDKNRKEILSIWAGER